MMNGELRTGIDFSSLSENKIYAYIDAYFRDMLEMIKQKIYYKNRKPISYEI